MTKCSLDNDNFDRYHIHNVFFVKRIKSSREKRFRFIYFLITTKSWTKKKLFCLSAFRVYTYIYKEEEKSYK